MAIISNGTTIASGGSLSVSPPAPSTGAVGSYASFEKVPAVNNSVNSTHAGSTMYWVSFNGNRGSAYGSGTWKCLGHLDNNGGGNSSTLFIRTV